MDCRALLFLCTAILVVFVAYTEGRTKKVVIHVPYKVKKIKHTHTVYKMVHHRHPLLDGHIDFGAAPTDDHEHFHHLHVRDEQPAFSHPVPGLAIPDFLPDVPVDLPLHMPDVPREEPVLPTRHQIPLYRRNKV